jgi:hypothetical protein
MQPGHVPADAPLSALLPIYHGFVDAREPDAETIQALPATVQRSASGEFLCGRESSDSAMYACIAFPVDFVLPETLYLHPLNISTSIWFTAIEIAGVMVPYQVHTLPNKTYADSMTLAVNGAPPQPFVAEPVED